MGDWGACPVLPSCFLAVSYVLLWFRHTCWLHLAWAQFACPAALMLSPPWASPLRRRVWRYAVNAVLYELRGERQGAVVWRDGAERVLLRKQVSASFAAGLHACTCRLRHVA